MSDYSDLLPSGYYLDLTTDPCVITLCGAHGMVVAHFTRAADLQEVKRVAEEELEEELEEKD
jgi:hypothetical protein